MVVGGNVVAWEVEEIGNRIVNGDEPNPIMMRVAGEKLIALLIAIGLLRAAKGIDWVGELVADAVVWIINQCDPKTRRAHLRAPVYDLAIPQSQGRPEGQGF